MNQTEWLINLLEVNYKMAGKRNSPDLNGPKMGNIETRWKPYNGKKFDIF
jgi:hypothetical protein